MNAKAFSRGRTLAIISVSVVLHGALLGQALPRANRILIEDGLQQQRWVPDGATFDPLTTVPSLQAWQGSNSTTATFYQNFTTGQAIPFNQTFLAEDLAANPTAQWGIAEVAATDSGKITAGPTVAQQSGYLGSNQTPYLSSLVSVQFGDEEAYATATTGYFQQWFALSKSLYPNVLVSSNQSVNEFGSDLATYVSTAQPDLITYDYYYLNGTQAGNYNNTYQNLQIYRLVSIQGLEGTGTQVPFGHYLQGYKIVSGPTGYIPSQSELNLESYAAWTMGAKWSSLFRWRYDNGQDYSFWNPGGGGTLSPQYTQFAAIQAAGNKLGPYLVRMNTSGLSFVAGYSTNIVSGVTQTTANVAPNNIPAWASDSTVGNISVTNVGGAACPAPAVGAQSCSYVGNVMLGYFTAIPNLGSYLSGYGLPAGAEQFFVTPGTTGLMVLNGFATSNTNPTSNNGDGGTGSETAQSVTITLTAAESASSVWQVNQSTGAYEPVATMLDQNGNSQFTTVLNGGTAGLFFITPSVTNVTNSVSITSTGLTYNRITKTGTETVTVTNTSAATIKGPLELALASNNSNVTAANASGTYQGNPYWTSAGSLAPGASATFTVSFTYPVGTSFITTPTLYSGGL